MELEILISQQVHLKVAPIDAKGTPRQVQDLKWALTSGDGNLVLDDDGLGAIFVPSDSPGVNVISVSADADLGAGVSELTDTATITTVAPAATSLGLTADEPTDKPVSQG